MTLKTVHYADLLGKPFEYGGRGPDLYDCYGLVVELHRRHNIALPDYTSTDDATRQGELFADGIDRYYEKVTSRKPLDIALFRLRRGHWHCGVVVDDYDRFVHITENTSVSCEELHDPIWKPRLVGIYRFIGADL
jgi:cell wall-associated NlpC family hydrolase